MATCGRDEAGSGPCILETQPGDPFGHWGGCSWESEDAWQPIPNDVCPACHSRGHLEVRASLPPESSRGGIQHLKSEYRCHACGETGAAIPARS